MNVRSLFPLQFYIFAFEAKRVLAVETEADERKRKEIVKNKKKNKKRVNEFNMRKTTTLALRTFVSE